MAVVAHKATKTDVRDPTFALRSALEDFKATLSKEQESEYRSAALKPDTSTVIAFVGKLDQTASSRTGRCVSSRLLNFLDALQQFTGIVDTFVSSNPAIAALIWGGVRTTILAASNISSFFVKITELAMEVGKLCPVYAQFGNLYPCSIQLQHALRVLRLDHTDVYQSHRCIEPGRMVGGLGTPCLPV